MTIGNEDVIRTFLADEARRAVAAAPSLDEAVGRLAPRIAGQPGGASQRLIVLIAATLLLVAALATAVAVGSGILRLPWVVDSEEPSVDLGIFAPIADRIVYCTDSGLWAVDPSAPSPTPTPVRLEGTADPNGQCASFTEPLGWSSGGTELLFQREDLTDNDLCCPDYLYILRADGTETQLNSDSMYTSGAAIAPDGSRVVFAAGDYRGVDVGLFVVDAEGGQPVRIAQGQEPTFSPDGTQIAYVSYGLTGAHVWVANADGSDAHEILAGEPALAEGSFSLAWSPAGDRIAMDNGLEGHVAIYTFAPDGSDFTEVITGGSNPHWSPDGSQIAYGALPGTPGLSIADADGSNVRTFDFGASGPWHPGETPTSVGPSVAPGASASPTASAAAFPTAVFAGLGEEPVSDELAAELQAVLNDMADGVGVSATVVSAAGTWSGATGKADGVRDVTVDDQFAIASVTKSVVAAQVMQMVEAGELGLDDTAADHLPPDLDFDTNGATIRQLLGHRSGLPGIDPAVFDAAIQESPTDDRQRVWTPAEILGLVLPDRETPGQTFAYTNTNYLLLGLVIEQLRGRPIAEVLRDGVLSIEGVDRLIYQPDEIPTEPMAMPFGGSTDNLVEGGGYLPSLAGASVDGAAAAMASDSPSLARWWRAFCAGEIVSQTSLAEMTTMHDGYGLGLYEADPPGSVGHGGEHVGYMSLAGCRPEQGVVVVVLSNDMIDTSAVAGPLVDVVSD